MPTIKEYKQNTLFSRHNFGPVIAKNRCDVLPPVLSGDWKDHYLKAMDYAKKLEVDVAHWKSQHGEACSLVAKMHASCVGYVGGPKRGVVEDVEDLRKDRDALKSRLESVEFNYRNMQDANRGLREQVKTMKERFDRIRIEAQLG